MMGETLRDEINKRLTLNWLIQGAAQHAGMTLHHLVRDELDAIDPKLLRLYDQYALINLLQYWHPDALLLIGSPPRFWRRAATSRRHPFYGHTLLSRYGDQLAQAARERALARCTEKGLTRLPVLFTFQTLHLIGTLRAKEAGHRAALTGLARKSAAMVWGIPESRLDAMIVDRVNPGGRITVRSLRAAIWLAAIVGYGGVEWKDGSLVVVARATNWQLVAKELVKGTGELICLHGMAHLDEDTYQAVVHAADRIEYEPWMLQTGGELWRRLLAVVPHGRPMAEVMMHMARLPAKALETLLLAVLEQPERGRELLLKLGEDVEA